MGALQKEEALPLISSPVAEGLSSTTDSALPAPPPLQEADEENPGDRGSWPFCPQLLGCLSSLFFSCCQCPWEQAGMESPRPGDPAALRKALEPGLWACSPVRPLPIPWAAGMGSFLSPQKWASELEGSKCQRWPEEGSDRTEFTVWNQRSGFKSWLFELCNHGQVTFLSLSLFICKPHSFVNLTNINEHLLYARYF